jgi:hypothetical protein
MNQTATPYGNAPISDYIELQPSPEKEKYWLALNSREEEEEADESTKLPNSIYPYLQTVGVTARLRCEARLGERCRNFSEP